jgi:uncharacterized membrane protein
MVYYGAVVLAAVTRLIRRPIVLGALTGSAIVSVATSMYLLWALFFRLRVWCPICLKGHAVNVVLLGLLVKLQRARES